MATQTGSIDLTASNGVKLMAEAGFESIEENYATKAELSVQADRIGMVVANNDASSSLQLTADAMTYIGNNVTIKGTDGTTTAISGGRIQANSLSIGAFDSAAQSATLNSNISVGGRNLVSYRLAETRTSSNVVWTPNSDGSMSATGTASAKSYGSANPTSTTLGSMQFPLCQAGTYTVSSPDGVQYNISIWDSSLNYTVIKSYNWSESYTFELSEAKYVCIGLRVESGTVTNKTYRIKLEKGNTATDWTPAPEDVDAAINNAAKTATSYVTELTGQNGIMVHPSTDQTTGVRITSDVDILRDGTSVINIGTGDAVRVGSASGGHIAIDSDSMDFWADADQLAMSFSGQTINDHLYLAKIEDGVTRENDDPYNLHSYISLYTLEEPIYSGATETVVGESMVTMHAYARDGDSAEISVYASKDPNASTASKGAIIAADNITCEGTTNVGDPYGNVDGIKLGDPARVTSSKSSTALANDTMGPDVVLTAGKWLIMGNWNFLNSSSNEKRLVVGLYRNATGQAYTYRVHTTASSNSAHRLEVVDTIVLTSEETITLYGASSPASTSAGTQWISAIRLA